MWIITHRILGEIEILKKLLVKAKVMRNMFLKTKIKEYACYTVTESSVQLF